MLVKFGINIFSSEKSKFRLVILKMLLMVESKKILS